MKKPPFYAVYLDDLTSRGKLVDALIRAAHEQLIAGNKRRVLQMRREAQLAIPEYCNGGDYVEWFRATAKTEQALMDILQPPPREVSP